MYPRARAIGTLLLIGAADYLAYHNICEISVLILDGRRVVCDRVHDIFNMYFQQLVIAEQEFIFLF